MEYRIKIPGCESTHFISWEHSGYTEGSEILRHNVLRASNRPEQINECPPLLSKYIKSRKIESN